MDGEKNNLKRKQIEEKYRFSDLAALNKEELLLKYKELYNGYIELQCQLEVSVEKLRLHESNTSPETSKQKYVDYNQHTKGIEKVIYILTENAKVMLSNEILAEILKLEPAQKQEWRTPYSAVMKYITRAVKAKRIVKYKVHTIGYTYGLPEWFDDDNRLKPKFKL